MAWSSLQEPLVMNFIMRYYDSSFPVWQQLAKCRLMVSDSRVQTAVRTPHGHPPRGRARLAPMSKQSDHPAYLSPSRRTGRDFHETSLKRERAAIWNDLKRLHRNSPYESVQDSCAVRPYLSYLSIERIGILNVLNELNELKAPLRASHHPFATRAVHSQTAEPKPIPSG